MILLRTRKIKGNMIIYSCRQNRDEKSIKFAFNFKKKKFGGKPFTSRPSQSM